MQDLQTSMLAKSKSSLIDQTIIRKAKREIALFIDTYDIRYKLNQRVAISGTIRHESKQLCNEPNNRRF